MKVKLYKQISYFSQWEEKKLLLILLWFKKNGLVWNGINSVGHTLFKV